MAEPAARDVVEKARTALGLDASHRARTWNVARMHPGRPGFVLVVFGEEQAATGLATVDPASGEVLESARLPGREPHIVMPAEDARRRAGLKADTPAQLVWEATPASRSPYYPLWQLRGPNRNRLG